ncbi:uncharacterized protein TRIADDRAFT_28052, partial [Trichoplax adhaerens]
TASLGKVIAFNLSDIGEGITEVSIKEWFVKVGDPVAQFDNVCEVQSDKASVTITSRYDGIVTKLYYEVDDIANVGTPLIDIELNDDAADSEGIQSTPEQQDSTPKEATQSRKVLATPAVRKIAMENKIDLAKVPATGKDGRVLKEDMLRYLEQPQASETVKEPAPISSKPTPKQSPIDDGVPVPIRGIRKAMVKTMTESLKVPQFGYCDEISMNALSDLIAKWKQSGSTPIGMMPFFIKAASLALKEFPILNSSVDENCENIIYKSSHNVGFAMDSEQGLIVPNIKNVQELSLVDVSLEFSRLRELGMAGKLGVDDLSGGTFTLSNIGSIGGTYSHPVILTPQVVIGAFGRTQVVPRFNESGQVHEAKLMNVSWSADHRIIEGAVMARFSNLWKSFVENPHLMLMHLK